MQLHWFLGDHLAGSGQTAVPFRMKYDEAFFCPLCGEIWLRRVRLGGPARWEVRSRPCSKCGGGTALYAHEALAPRSGYTIFELSKPLLIREFILRIDGLLRHQPEVI